MCTCPHERAGVRPGLGGYSPEALVLASQRGQARKTLAASTIKNEVRVNQMLRIWQSNTALSVMVVISLVGRWSQADLAECINVSRQTIVSLENGRYEPTLKTAMRLSAVFRCTDRGEDLQPRPRQPQPRSHRLTTRALDPQDVERLDSSGWTPIQRGHYEHTVTLRPGR